MLRAAAGVRVHSHARVCFPQCSLIPRLAKVEKLPFKELSVLTYLPFGFIAILKEEMFKQFRVQNSKKIKILGVQFFFKMKP